MFAGLKDMEGGAVSVELPQVGAGGGLWQSDNWVGGRDEKIAVRCSVYMM